MKIASLAIPKLPRQLSSEQLFMLTILMVNAGNYFYNLVLGRILGPAGFADAAILITLLLVLSFLGMTFQIVTAKYAVLFEDNRLHSFIRLISKSAVVIGIVFGVSIMIFYKELQQVFHTKTAVMFFVFGIGVPLYFLMSVNRGLYQGKNQLQKLSVTYQTEMISRLALTITAILLLPSVPTSILIASGISLSFVFGLIPFQKSIFRFTAVIPVSVSDSKSIGIFFALTAFYEFTQIIINNSDIILVKHFFDNEQAGLYASLALIGRVVYFVAWMFVMLLLPKVIRMRKEGTDTLPLLMKYVAYIVALSAGIVSFTAFFPEFVVNVMFGKAYLPIAFLLWKYALATSLFAVANIFAYYFLSINRYMPVVISAFLGLTQIGLIIGFHQSLEQVVHMQIIAMVLLLLFQLGYFFYHNKSNARLN